MILVPFPKHKKIQNCYVTCLLIAMIAVVQLLVKEYEVADVSLMVTMSESEMFHSVNAKLYKNFLNSEKNLDKNQRRVANIGDQERDTKMISQIALRDPFFNPLTASRVGVDDVSYKHWQETYYLLQEYASVNSASLLGIKSDSLNWQSWFSYMFVHAGAYHLISNLIFLFLFGALVERAFGGLMTVVIFLGSGLLVVPVYLLLTGEANIPLIGASGGVCGLIAFYATCKFKEPLRFFYWVLPFEKYYGFVTLYTGVVLFLWLFSDLAGYLASIPPFDGVAHAAHLGGFIAGASAGCAVLAYRKYRNIPILDPAEPSDIVGQRTPLISLPPLR